MRKKITITIFMVVLIVLFRIVQMNAPIAQVENAQVGSNINLEIWNMTQFAVERARKDHQTELDFTPESVEKLEAIVAKHEGSKPSKIEVAEWGAYLGEVIRKNGYGGDWKKVNLMGQEVVALERAPGTMVFPIEKVAKRIENGNEDNLAFYYKVIMAEHAAKPKEAPKKQ